MSRKLVCEYSDFVKLFLHLVEPGVNEKTSWNSILCGKIADIEQTHYSSHSNLIFEFRSDWRNGNNTGFRGTYRFLDKKLFHTDGELTKGSQCDYTFVSSATTNGTVRSRGRFYSLQYPSTYPKNIQCSYSFFGQDNERVKIILEQVRLQKSDLSCISSPDVILVYDGNDTSAPVIGQLCNINSYVELVSTGPGLYIEFLSRSHMPGQGFKGKFIFDTIANSANGNGLDIPSTAIPCDHTFDSRVSKNGTFTSPNFPDPYPANVHCSYHFNGQGKERIQILFTDFDLYRPDDTSRDCDAADTVMVFITINGQKERVDNFCGSDLPPQLMSNGPSLNVEFKSLQTTECTTETASDYVEFSNYRTVDRKLSRHCGLKQPKTVDSEGDFFRVTFKTNDRFDGTGFEAFYQFRSQEDHRLPFLKPIMY
ncbi:bone morphogenetic protein 1-like [Oppia nitens]|uniref:bone morphogenetic protein 1-like n=1 Tax=Oppia nitens TaxID=1686743 RepID=UPI0023DC256D|nr:bone morphogenetic protein 1-like [Oppia nitens]